MVDQHFPIQFVLLLLLLLLPNSFFFYRFLFNFYDSPVGLDFFFASFHVPSTLVFFFILPSVMSFYYTDRHLTHTQIPNEKKKGLEPVRAQSLTIFFFHLPGYRVKEEETESPKKKRVTLQILGLTVVKTGCVTIGLYKNHIGLRMRGYLGQ